MYCPECGKMIPDNENICPECGCNVSFESEAIRKKPVKKPYRGGGAIAAGIIAAAIGVAALEGAWFFLLAPKRAALTGAADAAATVKQTAPVNVAEITAAPLESIAVSAPAEADTLPDPAAPADNGATETPQAQENTPAAPEAPAAQSVSQEPAAQAENQEAAPQAEPAGESESQNKAPAQPTTPPQPEAAAEQSSKPAASSEGKTRNSYILPNSDTEYVTEEMLDKLKPNQVRAARNEIYARHGYIFKSEDLQKWFSSQQWYNGTVSDISVIEAELSELEWRNIEFINKYEESHS